MKNTTIRWVIDGLSILVVLAALSVGAKSALFSVSGVKDQVSSGGSSSGNGLVSEIESTGNRLGPRLATVVVLVFSSYTCGYCAEFHETLEKLLRRYPQHLAVVVKDFSSPSSLSHERVPLGAQCASEQGRFEEYHSSALRNHRVVRYTYGWRILADSSGIPDLDRFELCVASEATVRSVLRDFRDGVRLGVNATPTFFINGHGPIVGSLPMEQMDSLITAHFRGR